jgi:hypothetical protein
MNKDEKLIYFLGQLKSRIESLNDYIGINSPLYDRLIDIEQFFNKSVNDIYYSGANDDMLANEIATLVTKHHD